MNIEKYRKYRNLSILSSLPVLLFVSLMFFPLLLFFLSGGFLPPDNGFTRMTEWLGTKIFEPGLELYVKYLWLKVLTAISVILTILFGFLSGQVRVKR